MAKRKIPKELGLHLNAYHTVLYKGVPMWRCQAWAIFDYEVHGGTVQINSAIRSNSIIAKYKGKGLRSPYSSQEYLYENQHKPGFFPANPPNRTSHCGFSDGNAYFRLSTNPNAWAAPGRKIQKYQWGIDSVNRPGGDAIRIVQWMNSHGYKAIRPYGLKQSERHHWCFMASPATNARKRLARWVLTGR